MLGTFEYYNLHIKPIKFVKNYSQTNVNPKKGTWGCKGQT